MGAMIGIMLGFAGWFIVRYVLFGIYTVEQNERAVKTVWGRAEREGPAIDSANLTEEEMERYNFPRVRIIPPGGPYFKMPWESVYKVNIATETVSIGYDPQDPSVNQGGQVLEAVTKDQLNVGLTGQIRYKVSENNLYGYVFGIKNPRAHIMGFIHSVLREKIANFEAPSEPMIPGGEHHEQRVEGISINDLRKNLSDINAHMVAECKASEDRYGIILEDALITGIDPPQEVDSALAAINTAHNHVSSEISVAQASADQKIVQSRRAVEIETLRAQAEVEPLRALALQLRDLKKHGPNALSLYVKNLRLGLLRKARRVILEAHNG
ncbi:SPFH domain-containing protein [bacterium CPR1]|nr:SPFH domain-containing protein [bacterium CPR1]